MANERSDIHQTITDRIIAAIEAGAGTWQMPWHRGTGGKRPVNVASGRPYNGVNILALWVEAQARSYGSNLWGTYRQWASIGGQVRRGEKAAQVVFYKEISVSSAEESEDGEATRRLIARATPVFNADQVDGAAEPVSESDPATSIARAEAFVAATGARILHQGREACYLPSPDEIHMPARTLFTGSATSSATEAYYSTLLHELTHFTAPKHRCDRDLSGRFGSQSYAMEELVAELGAAFLCADLGISVEPRPDHAQYLAHWIAVMKADKRAIFTAASKASQAAAFLSGAAPS